MHCAMKVILDLDVKFVMQCLDIGMSLMHLVFINLVLNANKIMIVNGFYH